MKASGNHLGSDLVAEHPGIGMYAETALHDELKRMYAANSPEARLEVRVEGRVVDVVLPDELVEVQTRSLGSIATKLVNLACVMPIRLVYPVRVRTIIKRLDGQGRQLSSRTSPKRGDFWSIFDELVHAPSIVAFPNLRMDAVLVEVEESRQKDPSWNRRGDKVVTRRLLRVLETRSLDCKAQWLALLPASLPTPFDAAALALALGIQAERARKILYTYRKAGLVLETEKAGRSKRYIIAPA
ncbi:MAG TPA: hypothetical protein PLC54_00200 [Spirochaetales bacterium]|nr:hypothetical protein [Spirochaetales bacterium]